MFFHASVFQCCDFQVELITYGERYSELELAIQRINPATNAAIRDGNTLNSMLEYFIPYGVYKPVKLSMFGISDDQQLTARQILDLYHALAEVDPVVRYIFFVPQYTFSAVNFIN